MIIYGKPNELVSRQTRVRGKVSSAPFFQFDEDGEYFVPPSRVYDFTPDISDRLKEVGYIIKDAPKRVKVEYCKYCGMELENKGKLLAHYRVCKDNPKNQEGDE